MQRLLAPFWLAVAALSPLAATAQTRPVMPPPVLTAPGPGGERTTAGGLVGNWYPGAGTGRRPAILLLGGSEGGIGAGVARQAADLAAHGFAVLNLAYFGAPGLPARLDMVPLEYFDRAVAWLQARPTVRAGRLGIVGASKGAEAALLVAARHPDIAAVVVGAPSAAVWPGIDPTGGPVGSSWSYAGRPVEHLAYGGKATTMLGGYQAGLKTLAAHPGAAIPVERIGARILLVCGEADTLWPSCPMTALVARKVGARATVLSYRNAGHAVFGPPVAADTPGYRTLGALGGTAAGNDAAREAAWPKVLKFLTANLGTVR